MTADVRILVADDERAVRLSIAATLADAGYGVVQAKDGEEALERFRAERPDLVVLDVMMPKADGVEVCRRIRETDACTPIVFLTAMDADAAQIRGLAAGGDDYVSKTAASEVLLARVASALRRLRAEAPSGDFDFGGWRVRAQGLALTRPSGASVPVSEREVAIMRLFASHPGEVMNRDFLLTRFWGVGTTATDNTLNVCICALREKLGDDGALIKPVRGVGYAYRR